MYSVGQPGFIVLSALCWSLVCLAAPTDLINATDTLPPDTPTQPTGLHPHLNLSVDAYKYYFIAMLEPQAGYPALRIEDVQRLEEALHQRIDAHTSQQGASLDDHIAENALDVQVSSIDHVWWTSISLARQVDPEIQQAQWHDLTWSVANGLLQAMRTYIELWNIVPRVNFEMIEIFQTADRSLVAVADMSRRRANDENVMGLWNNTALIELAAS